MQDYVYPEFRSQKKLRVIFVTVLIAVALFEFLHGAFLSLRAEYMRPYAAAVFVFCGFFIGAAVFTLIKPHSLFKHVVSLILTAAGGVGMAAVGYILTHPDTTEDYYISGISEGTFWKYYAPCLLLIIPSVIMLVNELRRRKLQEINMPYEKQF